MKNYKRISDVFLILFLWGILFIVLKSIGVIVWNWWLVFLPIMAIPVFLILILVYYMLNIGIAMLKYRYYLILSRVGELKSKRKLEG